MSRTRVAVVGLGHAANDFHLPNLTQFEDVEILLCEIWPERLREGCARWKIPPDRAYSDLKTLLRDGRPNAVYFLLPQFSTIDRPPAPYSEGVLAVLESHTPIFVEKPLHATAPQAMELVQAAQRCGVKTTQCGFQRRFHPMLRYGLKRVAERGPLLSCSFSFFKGRLPGKEEERTIINQDWLTLDMIHCLDLMRSVPKGEMVQFASSVGQAPGDTLLTAFHALGKFSSGTTSIFTSNVRGGARVLRFELHGPGISVFIMTDPQGDNDHSMVAQIFTDDDVKHPRILRDQDVLPNPTFHTCAGFWQEDRHFVDCVKAGCATECDFADAYATVELCGRILNGVSGLKLDTKDRKM